MMISLRAIVLLTVLGGVGTFAGERDRSAEAPSPDTPKATAAAKGSVFRPADFVSLGALSPEGKSQVVFDTDRLIVSGAISGKGALGESESGKTTLAVFCFDEITLPATTRVTVVGSRGLVLLGRGAVRIDAKIDLSGGEGKAGTNSSESMGESGPGGWQGGRATKDRGEPGKGSGAGFCKRVKGGAAGGGGAFGGAGGASSYADGRGTPAMPGGESYGTPELVELSGGSGGAGGSHDRMSKHPGGGGGGGGAIAIVSAVSIAIGGNGELRVAGGAGARKPCAGGGGAGGSILLAAPRIALAEKSVLDASGGDGGQGGPNARSKPGHIGRTNEGHGGGGGGGRIALYSEDDFGEKGEGQVEKSLSAKGVTVTVGGGAAGGAGAQPGESGTLYDGAWPAWD